MRLLTAWRLPLRMARRDALRHRGRSLLVLFMIALPVLAVTAADVLISTSSVAGTESIDRRMGASQALITSVEGGGAVQQAPDPDDCCPSTSGDVLPMASAEQVSSLLDGARLLELRTDGARVTTEKGVADAEILETDLTDPLTTGLVRLESGRLPRADGEVVVNRALAEKGYAVGDTLDLTEVGDGARPPAPTIVGIAESTVSRNYPFAAGPLGSLGASFDADSSWLVDGGPVTWASVRQLNEIGATVASRSVIENPPPKSEQYPELSSVGTDSGALGVVGLIVAMALLEVVLLAGPAFAVGARKQQRSLALLAASGGTPAQSRRVIVAGALVLGSAAAALGVVLGIGAGWALTPVVQRYSDTWLGPFEVPWLHLAGVAGFGVLSAFLAAIVPASIAARQDVVAVLAGRRGDQPPSLRSPLLGAVLLGLGIALSVYGAVQQAGGEMFIAGGAIPAVLGMILLVPLVLSLVAKVAGRLPLVLRYAVRDADRHRTRTVPAVAAVAATVAGVVTLSIGLTSDQHENEETYIASVARGVGIVSAYDKEPRWDALISALQRELPGATVTEQRGLSDYDGFTEVRVPGDQAALYSSGNSLGASVMVSDGQLPVGLIGLSAASRARAEEVLAGGGMVAFTSPGAEIDATTAKLVHSGYDPETGEATDTQQATVPATYLPLTRPSNGPSGIVSTPVAEKLGIAPEVVALAVTGTDVSEDQEEAAGEALAAVDETSGLYVERGFRADDFALIAQLILIGLGGVLMLGGTLTATFLALSDARPDLATLAAIGASPRTRRGVAAAYAVVVGGVGALLGAAVGFIPGLAITWPLTAQSGSSCIVEGSGSCVASGLPTGPFIDVPWLMILGLVIVLPLLTALVVGLFARSRLPLVARLD